MPQNLLSDLKDIHYPASVSWWPLAPGWYLLIALLIGLLIVGVIYFIGAYKKYKLRRIVLQELANLRQQNTDKNIAAELSILLKRVAITYYPAHEVASLNGHAWLTFLDTHGKTTAFSQGVGKLLLSSPYQKNSPQHINELFKLSENWIRRQC